MDDLNLQDMATFCPSTHPTTQAQTDNSTPIKTASSSYNATSALSSSTAVSVETESASPSTNHSVSSIASAALSAASSTASSTNCCIVKKPLISTDRWKQNDYFLSLVVIGPLVVAYWRGTWQVCVLLASGLEGADDLWYHTGRFWFSVSTFLRFSVYPPPQASLQALWLASQTL